MELRKIQDADLGNKRVLLRAGFNVEIENGNVKEKFKIAAAKDTVEYILSQENAKLALIAHLGRPEGKFKQEFSLRQIVDDVEKILNRKVKFAEDCVGEAVKRELKKLNQGEILLLENVRFHQEEKNNERKFAEKMAENFDIYINDAFGVCHRRQASVVKIAEILPSFAGIRLQEEVKNLGKVKNVPEKRKPAVAVIGGIKIDTKLPLIRNFEKNYDYILVGGKVSIEAMNRKVKFSGKVILTFDFAEGKKDIGEKTIAKFKEIILQAKTVVWNGPMGEFENPPFDKGTKELVKAVIESGAFSVMGGGESVQILEENGWLEKISFVSTGGGAMLEYLSGGEMPGLEVLRRSSFAGSGIAR